MQRVFSLGGCRESGYRFSHAYQLVTGDVKSSVEVLAQLVVPCSNRAIEFDWTPFQCMNREFNL